VGSTPTISHIFIYYPVPCLMFKKKRFQKMQAEKKGFEKKLLILKTLK